MTEVVSLPSVVDVTFSNASSGMESLFRYVDFMRGVHTLQIDVEFGYDIMELAEIIIDLHHIKSLKLHGITNATDFNLADFFCGRHTIDRYRIDNSRRRITSFCIRYPSKLDVVHSRYFTIKHAPNSHRTTAINGDQRQVVSQRRIFFGKI